MHVCAKVERRGPWLPCRCAKRREIRPFLFFLELIFAQQILALFRPSVGWSRSSSIYLEYGLIFWPVFYGKFTICEACYQMWLFRRVVKEHPAIDGIFINKLKITKRSLEPSPHIFFRHIMASLGHSLSYSCQRKVSVGYPQKE